VLATHRAGSLPDHNTQTALTVATINPIAAGAQAGKVKVQVDHAAGNKYFGELAKCSVAKPNNRANMRGVREN
jgi:hypothetical protein